MSYEGEKSRVKERGSLSLILLVNHQPLLLPLIPDLNVVLHPLNLSLSPLYSPSLTPTNLVLLVLLQKAHQHQSIQPSCL
jgi:hypothetical protein